MTPKQHQKIINDLQNIITETIDLMDRFEEKGMQEDMAADYQELHEILARATKQQRQHMQALLASQKTS